MTNFIIQLRKNVREIALSSFVMALFYLTFQKWYDFTLLFPFSKFQLHVQSLSSVHSSSLDRTDAIHFDDDPHSSDIFFELDVQEKYLLRNIVTAGASKHDGFNSSNLPASNKKLVEGLIVKLLQDNRRPVKCSTISATTFSAADISTTNAISTPTGTTLSTTLRKPTTTTTNNTGSASFNFSISAFTSRLLNRDAKTTEMLTALGPPTNISKTANITNYDNDNYNHNSSTYDISYNNNNKRDVDVSNNEELGTTVGKKISGLCWDDSVQLIFEQIETISGGFLATHASRIINCIFIPLVCYMNVLNCVTAKVRNTICTFMLGASAVVQLFGLVSFMMTVNELSNYLQEHQSFPTSRYKIHYDLGFYVAILLFIATNMAAVITSFNLDGEIGRDRENGLVE